MSDEEIVEGYVNGRLSRRMFVRRLILGGLSMTGAVAFANALAPGQASAVPNVTAQKNGNHHGWTQGNHHGWDK